MNSNDLTIREMCRLGRDVLENRDMQALRTFPQHGTVSRYEHCLAVCYIALRLADKWRVRVDRRSMVRGALLHDFFGYDWHSERFRRFVRHYSGFRRLTHMHGFIHGHIAAARAKRVFGLSDRECDAIARHMFPLAPIPRSRIAWIVTLADKAVASKEVTLAAGDYIALAYHRVFA